jgi:hypothetical protein
MSTTVEFRRQLQHILVTSVLTANKTLFNFETYTTCVVNAALNMGVVE